MIQSSSKIKQSNYTVILIFVLLVNLISFGQEVCGDNFDNDFNGFSDCDDSGCTPCTSSDKCSIYSPRLFANTGIGATYSGTGNIYTINGANFEIGNLDANSTNNFQSRTLTLTGLGNDIPTNATINGVRLTMVRSAEAGGTVFDTQIQLTSAGSAIGNNIAFGNSHYWPDSIGGTTENAIYGSSGSTWGATLTPAIVNASDFGILLKVETENVNTVHDALIDLLTIEVCYSYNGEDCSNLRDDDFDDLLDCSDDDCPSCVNADTCITLIGKVTVSGSGASISNPTRAESVSATLHARFNNLTMGSDDTSQCLNMTNFSFNIPSSANIVGVELEMSRSAQSNNAIQDAQIQLINSGVEIGNNISTAQHWQTDTSVYRFGSANSTWGATLTPAIVNSPDFGARIKVQNLYRTGNIDARLFYVAMKVCIDLGPEICDNNLDDDLDGLQDQYDTIDCPCTDDGYFNACISSCTYVPVANPYSPADTWTGQFVDPRETPLVGDVDNDDTTEIIIDDYGNPGIIYILNGRTGATKYTINTGLNLAQNNSCNGIADTDRDGFGEIYVIASDRNLARYDFDGTTWSQTWITTGAQTDNNQAMPHFADFDGDGTPEVYCNDAIFEAATGNFIGESSANITTATSTFAADILPQDITTCPDCAGLELIAGGRIYGVDIANGTVIERRRVDVSITDLVGPTSTADVDGDGDLDVVYTASLNNGTANVGHLVVWDGQTSNLLMPVYEVPAGLSGNQGGGTGRVNIADFDGDGELEFGFCGLEIYVVVDDIGTLTLGEPTTLWSLLTTDGSAITGSTVFDFEADGAFEVIYRDEDTLFVLNGADGAALFKSRCTSGTRYEYPIVADVNDDGQTEICVTCGTGVSTFTSSNLPWVTSRNIWNQHGYNVTNVNDDLTIPAVPGDNATVGGGVYNNFLTQSTPVAGDGTPVIPVADLTPRFFEIVYEECDDSVTYRVEVTNNGSLRSPVIDLSFYDTDPTTTNANLLKVVQTNGIIRPGNVDTVDAKIQYTGSSTIFVMANDPGTVARPYDTSTDFPASAVAECEFSDNLRSQFVDCVTMPLPVSDLLFEAILNKNKVDLSWQTSSEINNSHFDIERSVNLTNWEKLGEINGSGNSSTTIHYYDNDLSPLKGTSYYRVKQIDFDGQFTYSNMDIIKNNQTNNVNFEVYPNPTNNENITILLSEFTNKELNILVTNALGQQFHNENYISKNTNEALQLEIQNKLASGVYLVTIKTKSNSYTKRLIIK